MKKIFLIVSVVIGLVACESDDYLVDGGISDGHVGTTTFEFLKSHPQLDTLAILLERAGLNDEVNGATTLFAPNNLSIKKYLIAVQQEMQINDPTATYTLDDIPVDTLTKYLPGYIFAEKITRDDLTEEGKLYTALNGEQTWISLEPSDDFTGGMDEFPEYVFFYYDNRKVYVRISNLISTNGVIHVLQGDHILFNY